MKPIIRIAGMALVAALSLSAQTMQQALELQKSRQYQAASNVFEALVKNNPNNADYHVAWGKLFLIYSMNGDATEQFKDALKINPNHAGAYLGLAWAEENSFGSKAREYAAQALKLDPKLVEAQELLARIALEDNNNSRAESEAKKALEIDPKSVHGRAILAILDWLSDKKDSAWDPHDARGYETAGHFFMLNRRYEEAIAFYRKAIDLDPELYSARSEMAVNMMRLGQSDEAYVELEKCYNAGLHFPPTSNTLMLLDTLKKFSTFKTDNTILKLNAKEADLLHSYVESEMKRDIADYEKKYKMKLDRPVQVEVYPNHDDFAVRTLGVPGLGALGVTFGTTIAMDSPSGRPPGEFHWASTLRHEMSHVFTLTMTNSRVPRWFTEGIAVHEETASSPEWGDRLGPDEITAIKEHKLLPILELDRGFIHPTFPQQVIVSYFQGGKICDYITEKWGWDTILAMLHDFANDEGTAAVIRKELKIEPDEFDKQFHEYVEGQTKKTVENFDAWKDGMKKVAEAARKKDNDAVIQEGAAIRDLYPDYVESGSDYEYLAHAYLDKGDKAHAIEELERYLHIGGRNPASIKLLAKELADAGRKKDAAEALDRLNYIYPIDGELHQRLGDLWLDQSNATGAIREFQAVLAYKPIDPAQAHYDLARAYHLNHQPDKAKEELVAALEIAPGFRPAQKLFLQLSQGSEPPQASIKK